MTGARGAGDGDGERLSLRTLVIASVASATAALITSRFWAPGTAFTAALTPLIVAIVSEFLHRPAEHAAQRRASRRATSPEDTKAPAGERPETPTAQTTRAGGRRRLHLKLAFLTGAIAFAIAVAVLTLPELIFGRAVATNRETTIFGGGSHKPANPQEQGPQPTQTAPPATETAPRPPATTPPPTSPPTNPQPPPIVTPRPPETNPTP
jgi:hypothetical protein